MKLFDLNHPFFAPRWRRIAVVVVCIGWAVMEFIVGSPGWGAIFGALGVYAGWHFWPFKAQVPPTDPRA